jgi:hypothetical protein
MYLAQARRLRTKSLAKYSLQLLSLEQLRDFHHRTILLAFPLLTAGIIIGMALLVQALSMSMAGAGVASLFNRAISRWADPRLMTALVLWAVLAILVCLGYSLHTPSRRVALLTTIALILLIVSFAMPHHFTTAGGVP